MDLANESRCYCVMPSFIGWTYTQNDPWSLVPMECHITHTHRCYKIVRITVYLDKPNFAHAIHATGELVLLSLLHTRINSLWPSDVIWQYRPGSTLAPVMACCLRHQAMTCWLIIRELWTMTIPWRQFHKRYMYLSHQLLNFAWKLHI